MVSWEAVCIITGVTALLSELLLGLSLLQVNAADDKPALKDQKEKVSYGIGLNIGSNLKRSGYDVNVKGRLPDLLPAWSVRRLAEIGLMEDLDFCLRQDASNAVPILVRGRPDCFELA